MSEAKPDTNLPAQAHSQAGAWERENQFSRKGAKTQRKDGQYNRDKNQIKDGIERVVSGLQAFVNAGRMLFFAPFAALRETDVEPGRLG